MIAHANAYKSALASFSCEDMFAFDAPSGAYDIVSALGVIEYISFEQLRALLAKSHRLLPIGGLLCIGSRNRLFNIFSANAYTTLEIELGTVYRLVRENVALATLSSMEALVEEASQVPIYLEKPSQHPDTGISVTVRYQYTPCELINLLAEYGFRPLVLSPVNVHLGCVSYCDAHKDEYEAFMKHCATSRYDEWRLLPSASTFVMTAVKL